jgi:hypothetical protein
MTKAEVGAKSGVEAEVVAEKHKAPLLPLAMRPGHCRRRRRQPLFAPPAWPVTTVLRPRAHRQQPMCQMMTSMALQMTSSLVVAVAAAVEEAWEDEARTPTEAEPWPPVAAVAVAAESA